MRLRRPVFLICLFAVTQIPIPAVWADPVSYFVTVDTSSVFGSGGFIDLQLAPGDATTQDATADVTGYSGGTLVGAPVLNFGGLTGASGALPGTVTIDNVPGNDYFQGFTFGNALSFKVSLDGPAIKTPDGTADSGSTFVLAFYADDGATLILTTNLVDGSAAEIFINLDGTTTPVTYAGTPGGPSFVTIRPESPSTVPEPGSFWEIGTALILALGAIRYRQVPRTPGQPIKSAY
jgi:hypothetical protein